jgi:hypothetical protein
VEASQLPVGIHTQAAWVDFEKHTLVENGFRLDRRQEMSPSATLRSPPRVFRTTLR